MVSKMKQNTWHTKSAKETIACGREIAAKLSPGSVVALIGDLGSGKTTLVKGIAAGFGIKDAHRVKSPTFVIFHIYQGKIPIYHFDLYRLNHDEDLDNMGFEEFFADRGAVSVVEWADRIPSLMAQANVTVELSADGENERTIRMIDGKNS